MGCALRQNRMRPGAKWDAPWLFNLKPWPHKNSVVIYENKIIVCWQEEELEYVKKVLMEQPESKNGE